MRVEKLASGTLEMTWDSETRLAVVRHAHETRAAGQDATVLVDALTRWIGMEGKPFGFLVDGAKAAGLDIEFRSTWARFFQQHREESVIALFNLSPMHRVVAEMFRIGTGIRLKAFADEASARAWLRQMGHKG